MEQEWYKQLMHIQIDFRSGTPIYIQITDQVRRQVESGDLRPGDQLPTVRQLATELRVNFNTVARAYRLLDEAGLISTQQGRGTYIWESTPPEAAQQLHQRGLEALSSRFLAQAYRLGFTPEEVLSMVEKQANAWKSGTTPDQNHFEE